MNRSPDREERVGLCADCRHMRAVRSDRGAVFYQCRRAERDPSFPRYPHLPVLSCRGYEHASDGLAQTPAESS
jgi:hypothetical protein